MERAKEDATERVGQIALAAAAAPATPAAAQRWEQRVEALVAWLLAEWQREQRKEAA